MKQPIPGLPVSVITVPGPVRPDAARTIRSLRAGGISRIVLVTGDRAEVAGIVGAVIGVDEVLAERAPAEKLDAVRMERGHAPTIMVGDGMPDDADLADLRALLYGLHAILRLHTAQEDESYLSLGEDVSSPLGDQSTVIPGHRASA